MIMISLLAATALVQEPSPGLRAQLYDLERSIDRLPEEKQLTNLKLSRIEPQVRLEIDQGEFPGSGLRDFFFVRWTGILRVPKADRWRFSLISDDGSRLWIGGRLIVDNDGLHAATEKRGEIDLRQGDHDIRIDYFEAAESASCVLYWETEGVGRQIVPASALFHVAKGVAAKIMSPAELETLALQMDRWEEMIPHHRALLIALKENLPKVRARAHSIKVSTPEMIGRVTNVFADGPKILVMVKQSTGLQNEVAVYLHSKTLIEYDGLSRRNRKPKSGLGIHAWLKEGSTDLLSRARFVSEERHETWKEENRNQRDRLTEARRELREVEEELRCRQAEIRNVQYRLDTGRLRYERALKHEAKLKKESDK